MRKLLILVTILFLASCKSKKISADSTNKFVIENLAEVVSGEALKTLFPNAEISEGTSLFEEATVERAYTILFPDTPNEALLTWKDANRTELHNIRVENGGDWKSETGIEIGSTLEELQRINGKEVKFYGFGWDYSGAVDWNGGKLANTNIRVFLAPEDTPPNKFYGDHVIEATEEEIEALDLKVHTILYQEKLQ